MPELPDTTVIVVAMLAVLAGATVLSTVGFGLGMTVTPLLLLVTDAQTVVVLVNTVPLMIYVLVIAQARRALPVREMTPVVVAGLLGVPVGVYVLSAAPDSVLRVAMAVLVLALTAMVALGVKMPRARGLTVIAPIGFATGALVTATGIGGPLLALALLGRGGPPDRLRTSLSLFFLLTMLSGVAGYWAAGMFTARRVTLALAVTGPVLLGFRLGTAIVGRMNESTFRRSVIGVIALTSLLVLGRQALRLAG